MVEINTEHESLKKLLETIEKWQLEERYADITSFVPKKLLHQYLTELARISDILSCKDENDLILKTCSGDRKATSTLFTINLEKVVFSARRKLGKGLPLLALIQAGNAGLKDSIDKYGPRCGYDFCNWRGTYVNKAMDQAINAHNKKHHIDEPEISQSTPIRGQPLNEEENERLEKKTIELRDGNNASLLEHFPKNPQENKNSTHSIASASKSLMHNEGSIEKLIAFGLEQGGLITYDEILAYIPEARINSKRYKKICSSLSEANIDLIEQVDDVNDVDNGDESLDESLFEEIPYSIDFVEESEIDLVPERMLSNKELERLDDLYDSLFKANIDVVDMKYRARLNNHFPKDTLKNGIHGSE